MFSRPEFRGRLHGDDFEINQVGPAANPSVKQFRAGSLHDLKAAGPAGFHPACVVRDALWEHAAVPLKAFPDRRLTARPESFDDHEEHGGSLYPLAPWGNRRTKSADKIGQNSTADSSASATEPLPDYAMAILAMRFLDGRDARGTGLVTQPLLAMQGQRHRQECLCHNRHVRFHFCLCTFAF